MPGNNDIHPRRVAEQVRRLIPNAHWVEVRLGYLAADGYRKN
jgi:hypothetical protein